MKCCICEREYPTRKYAHGKLRLTTIGYDIVGHVCAKCSRILCTAEVNKKVEAWWNQIKEELRGYLPAKKEPQ